MKTEPKIFLGHIHNDSYVEEYAAPNRQHTSIICDAGRKTEKLDGKWNFSPDQYDYCLRAKWFLEIDKTPDGFTKPIDYDFDGWETISVPGVWNTQKKEYFYYEGPGVYSKRFYFKKDAQKKERVFIKFGAVYYTARIFLNKQYVGCHKGGSTPFYIEVTDFLQENNRLIVVADNARKSEHIPSLKTDWFNYGGITRSVEIIRTPVHFIKDFSIGLKKESFKKDFSTELYAKIVLDSPVEGTVQLRINELKINETVTIKNGIAEFLLQTNCILWEPDNPKLYEVSAIFTDAAGAMCDTVCDNIGFRHIEVRGLGVYLNGKKIYLKGVCAHEESVENGKAVTSEEIVRNYTLAKELGCNFMRLAHYPHNEDAAKIADKMGLLLWEEIPVYWSLEYENKETFEDAQNQLSELIIRDKNRASVIIWSVGNETPDSDERLKFMVNLVTTARKLDSTRLISAACLIDHKNHKINDRLEQYLDIIGINEYYGWYDPVFDNLLKVLNNSKPQKPVIITEFGADAMSGEFGTVDEKGTENCQEAIYLKQVGIFAQTEYIQGTAPWILFDFRTPRRVGKYQKGYNTKGLVSADKTYKKRAFFVMQDFYKNMQ